MFEFQVIITNGIEIVNCFAEKGNQKSDAALTDCM